MPRKQIRAVLFDLDGTLLDTLADIAAAMNTTLERYGLPPHDVDAYRQMVGSGFRKLVERAVASHSGSLSDEKLDLLEAGLREEYTRHAIVHTRPYSGVPAMLNALQDSKTPMAILSNKSDALVQKIVRTLLAGWDFCAVIGLRDHAPAKPDPTTALEAARSLGVEPTSVLYLGDSDVDMKTAQRAGMLPVGAAWGFRGPEELAAAGAAAIIDNPRELLALINGAGNQQ